MGPHILEDLTHKIEGQSPQKEVSWVLGNIIIVRIPMSCDVIPPDLPIVWCSRLSWHQVGGSCYRSHVDTVPWYHMVPTFITKGLYVTNLLIRLRNWSVWDKAWLDETSLFWFYHQRAISSKTNGIRKLTPLLESFVQIGTSWRKSQNICRLSASWKWPPLGTFWVDSGIAKEPRGALWNKINKKWGCSMVHQRKTCFQK